MLHKYNVRPCSVNNSISIIKNGTIVQTLSVGNGPRSLATDGYGKIYVANYLGDTVSVLIPKDDKYITLKTIKTDSQPIAVAVNYNNDAYIACKSSIIKIRKNGEVRKFTIDGRPTSLTADKYGNIWATNNTNSTIIKISQQEIITTYASGSEGPMYCCSDKNGDIIILNTATNKITRLNEDGSLVNTIELDYTPIGNGDFIGFLSRINILDDIPVHDVTKVEWDDLSDEVKERIEQGGVDPETLIIKSDNVTFENDEYHTVTEAINGLLYEKSGLLDSDIEEFEIVPSIVAKGSTVSNITFNYKINQNHGLAIAELNNDIGSIPIDGTSYEATGLSISEDTEFTITATTNQGYKGTKSAKLKFDIKIYFGLSNNIITTPENVLRLSNYVFVEDNNKDLYNNKFTFINGNGYMYMAIPSSLGITINDFTTAGFKDSNWETLELPIMVDGNSIQYTLFRSGFTHALLDSGIDISITKNK